jgi:hypothetical protein
MHERPKKRRGPILFITDAVRAQPRLSIVLVLIWALFFVLPLIAIFIYLEFFYSGRL